MRSGFCFVKYILPGIKIIQYRFGIRRYVRGYFRSFTRQVVNKRLKLIPFPNQFTSITKERDASFRFQRKITKPCSINIPETSDAFGDQIYL